MTAISAHTGLPVDQSLFSQGVSPGEVMRQQAGLREHHLRPERCELDWHMHNFARRVYRVDGGGYTRMFHPFDVARSREEAGSWCKDIAKHLFTATPFQVTAPMVDAVAAVYEKTAAASEGGLFHFDEADVPAPSGFLWLDKPMIITDKWGRAVAERAITWNTTTITAQFMYQDKRKDWLGQVIKDPEPQIVPALRLSTWSSIADDRKLLEEQQRAGLMPQPLPDEMGESVPIAWDYLWGEWNRLEALGPLSLSHTLVTGLGPMHTWDYGKAPHPEEREGDYRPDNMIAWIHALFMFMQTEIVSTPRVAPGSGMRRKAWYRSLKHDDVTVVLLRRSHSLAGPTGAHRDVDWSCQWLVSGFWRHVDRYDGETHRPVPAAGDIQQDEHEVKRSRCAVCQARGQSVRITWVRPHLRGPDDKPLKGGEKLFKVAR